MGMYAYFFKGGVGRSREFLTGQLSAVPLIKPLVCLKVSRRKGAALPRANPGKLMDLVIKGETVDARHPGY